MSRFEGWTPKQFARLSIFPIVSLLFLLGTIFWNSDGAVSRNNYWGIQLEWFQFINEGLSEWFILFTNLTQLGDAIILLPILSFFIFARPQVWAAFFGSIPLGLLLSAGGKYVAAVPRPGVVLDPLVYKGVGSLGGYNSLPSGHTITIFCVVTVVIFVFIPVPRRKTHHILLGLGLFVATLIGLSRVAVGVHWPLDVVAGAAFGYLAGVSGVYLTQRYLRWWCWLKMVRFQFILGGIMLMWSFSLFKKVFNDSDSTDIVVWVAASVGFMTSIYILFQGMKYYKMTRT